MIAAELAGLFLLAVALGLLWLARPAGLRPAPFIASSYWIEVGYTLLVLFTAISGLGVMLWGFLVM